MRVFARFERNSSLAFSDNAVVGIHASAADAALVYGIGGDTAHHAVGKHHAEAPAFPIRVRGVGQATVIGRLAKGANCREIFFLFHNISVTRNSSISAPAK